MYISTMGTIFVSWCHEMTETHNIILNYLWCSTLMSSLSFTQIKPESRWLTRETLRSTSLILWSFYLAISFIPKGNFSDSATRTSTTQKRFKRAETLIALSNETLIALSNFHFQNDGQRLGPLNFWFWEGSLQLWILTPNFGLSLQCKLALPPLSGFFSNSQT